MGLGTHTPGLHPSRLMRLAHEAVTRCDLDLSGATVLTEAATGAYVVTPVLAALAGAERVFAFTRTTRYGAVADVTGATMRLARIAGVADRLTILTEKRCQEVALADIITNSGHLRPLDAAMVSWMRSSAVVPLMFESWEFRSKDLDLAACEAAGIPVAGTNERHESVDVFSYLGILAVKALLDAGVSVVGSRVLVLCDNPFFTFIVKGLAGAGAQVEGATRLEDADMSTPYDSVLVALRPHALPVLNGKEVQMLANCSPGAVVVQFWGDLDRATLTTYGIPYWPATVPPQGHMGVLLSEIGPAPVVRLQAGGLKVGEILWKARRQGASPLGAVLAVEATGYGSRINGIQVLS